MKVFLYLLLTAVVASGVYFITKQKPEFIADVIESEDVDSDDDDGHSIDTRQQLVQGSLTVKILTETQKLAGIQTVSAENITLDVEEKAFASVIDIAPLLELRAQYRNLQASNEIARTRLKNAAITLERLETLHSEASNISLRELQQARSEWERERATLQAEQVQMDNIRARMLQQWNATLTDLALKPESEIFARIIRQEDYLVLLTLRSEQQLTDNLAYVYVNRTDDRNTARKAYLISAAPFSQMSMRGETYFLRTPADKLRIGMQLHVWLPNTGFTGTGISIPNEAIVWYAGQAWAYVKIDAETFSRRSLPDSLKTSQGWLVRDNFEIGDEIVISGAQTLLSEEFKWAIPDEDDD